MGSCRLSQAQGLIFHLYIFFTPHERFVIQVNYRD